jgi:uncharacterized protein YbbC (DUF1343 family)
MRPGIDTLLDRHAAWLRGRRLALVGHQAAVDARGCPSVERLRRHAGDRLAALLGPEHGFDGAAAAGVRCAHRRHRRWGIPVYSLYGAARKPAARMLRGIDTLVVDLQDLGVRCYTYVSTLRLVLEAAARSGTDVIIADRPVPLPRVLDGPVLRPECRSFVGLIDAPLCYGMTPGETASWLNHELGLGVRLRVARMHGYRRDSARAAGWPPWVPPSPAIVSWESALCYAATVVFEALGAVDYGRGTPLPFQVVGAPWIRGEELAGALSERRLPGLRFYAHAYTACAGAAGGKRCEGVRLVVADAARVRPAAAAVCMVHTLQRLYGRRRVWAPRLSRPEFFDRLFGDPAVRLALLEGEDGDAIRARWRAELRAFGRRRKPHLLYAPGRGS